MNLNGILTAAACFACIGLFHPIVIWAEYYWSARCWPLFLFLGLALLAGSLFVPPTLGSTVLGALGCSCLWSIPELHQQEKRVARGWFPRNPRRAGKSTPKSDADRP